MRRGHTHSLEGDRRRARRLMGRALLQALDADERTMAEVFLPDEMLRILAQLPTSEARAEIRRMMDGMTRRGYTMTGLAECFTEGADDE